MAGMIRDFEGSMYDTTALYNRWLCAGVVVTLGIAGYQLAKKPLSLSDIELPPKVAVPSTATGGAEVPIVMKDKWVSAAPAPDKRGPNITSTLPST